MVKVEDTRDGRGKSNNTPIRYKGREYETIKEILDTTGSKVGLNLVMRRLKLGWSIEQAVDCEVNTKATKVGCTVRGIAYKNITDALTQLDINLKLYTSFRNNFKSLIDDESFKALKPYLVIEGILLYFERLRIPRDIKLTTFPLGYKYGEGYYTNLKALSEAMGFDDTKVITDFKTSVKWGRTPKDINLNSIYVASKQELVNYCKKRRFEKLFIDTKEKRYRYFNEPDIGIINGILYLSCTYEPRLSPLIIRELEEEANQYYITLYNSKMWAEKMVGVLEIPRRFNNGSL